MKNFDQYDDKITVPAPRDLLSGGGALVGALFGFAEGSALTGESVVLVRRGVVSHEKQASQAWTVGQKVYWDNTNFRLTTTVGSNTLVGVASVDVAGGAGDTIGYVLLGLVA